MKSVEPQRELDDNHRPLAMRTGDLERPARALGPVAEADQARAAGGIGAANAVVADRDAEAVVPLLDSDAHNRRVRVLCRVGERLGDDVIRCHLGRLG